MSSQAEPAAYTIVATYRAAGYRGSTLVDVRCPGCQATTRVAAWSLAATGKRCACGLVLRQGFAVAAYQPPSRREKRELSRKSVRSWLAERAGRDPRRLD